MSTETPNLKPTSASKTYVIRGTRFNTAEEAIAILKNDSEFTMEDFYHFFALAIVQYERFNKQGEERWTHFREVMPYTDPEDFYIDFHQVDDFIPQMSKEQVKALVDSVKPMTVTEAFDRYVRQSNNSEQLMRALSYFSPEDVVKGLKANLINEEVITKKQKRAIAKTDIKNDKNVTLSEDDFEEIEVTFEDTYKLYQIDKNQIKTSEDAYVVECNCTSTGKKYFLFVEPNFASSAIDAIASTMRDENGKRMSRKQYMELDAES